MQKGVEVAGPVLDEYLDGELARLGLPPERLALAGFSPRHHAVAACGPAPQGPARRDRGIFRACWPAPPPAGGDIPPILLTHGDSDQVIPPQAMFLAATQLGVAGAGVQWHLARGMGHGIDPEGLAMAGEFLDLAFRGLLKSQGEVRCVLQTVMTNRLAS